MKQSLFLIFTFFSSLLFGQSDTVTKSKVVKEDAVISDINGHFQKKVKGDVDSNGMAIGEWKWAYLSGKKQLEGSYKNGKPTGIWTRWYENGNVKDESHYSDSGLFVKSTSWWENGKLKQETSYNAKGQYDGIQMQYHTDGTKLYEQMYKNGKVIHEGHYFNGKKTGGWTYMLENKSYRIDYYNDDVLIKTETKKF